jgi:hypothetical protein
VFPVQHLQPSMKWKQDHFGINLVYKCQGKKKKKK